MKNYQLTVINTVVSTVFAVSIIMSQALINVNPTFWYLDPVLSIILAVFMAAFGIKVIHQNFNVLRPVYRSTSTSSLLRSFSSTNLGPNYTRLNKNSSFIGDQTMFMPQATRQTEEMANGMAHHFGANLNTSIEYNRHQASAEPGRNNWQKSDYSTIAFI